MKSNSDSKSITTRTALGQGVRMGVAATTFASFLFVSGCTTRRDPGEAGLASASSSPSAVRSPDSSASGASGASDTIERSPGPAASAATIHSTSAETEPSAAALAETGSSASPPVAVRTSELSNASESIETLVRRAIASIVVASPTELAKCVVTFPEYRDILWPEFEVAKRDARLGLGAERQLSVHWANLRGTTDVALRRILQSLGGKNLELIEVSAPSEVETFDSYQRHKGVVVRLRMPDGSEELQRFFGSIIEHDGKFKLLSLRD
jgi:hypothetical protein